MAERKRATGFVLMDAAFTADAKFVRLARNAGPHQFAAAVGVFWLLLADCRRSKSPMIPWDEYEEYTDEIAMLKAARLLKEDGFHDESFQRWAPAYRSVSERTRLEGHPEHGAYPSVPHGISNTVVSGLVRSGQVNSNGVGGAGEGVPTSFIRYPVKVVPGIDRTEIDRQHAESLADAARKTAEREAAKRGES